MANNNPWVRYIDRSYETIKASIFAALRINTPEITDFSDSNIATRFVQIFAGIADQLGYNTDRVAQETFLLTAKRYKNVVKIANAYDYRIKGALGAEVTIRFYFASPIPTSLLIPAGTIVQTTAGIQYETLTDVTIPATPATAQIFVQAVQRVKVTATPQVSNGTANQIFALESNIIDGSLEVKVNGVSYFAQETFAYSSANSLHFVASINEDGLMQIKFGDGVNGQIPPTNATIEINYYTTAGAEGNVSELSINQIVSVIANIPNGFTLLCENQEVASGGVDSESLSSIAKRVPLFVRTLERAVTEKDFKDVTELAVGVAKAGVIHACGEPLQIVIAPESGGIAPPTLINSVVAWLNERKTINIDIEVSSVGVVYLSYDITLTVLPNFSNASTRQLVIDALLELHSVNNQDVNGSIAISDIFQAIENVAGVRNSRINSINIEPYARQTVGVTTTLNWVRLVKSTSTSTVKWYILFTSPTAFQLYKNNVLDSTHSINTPVSKPEVDFTVQSGAYLAGDRFDFVTYPFLEKFNGGLQLDEPSIIQTTVGRIAIVATGGL